MLFGLFVGRSPDIIRNLARNYGIPQYLEDSEFQLKPENEGCNKEQKQSLEDPAGKQQHPEVR